MEVPITCSSQAGPLPRPWLSQGLPSLTGSGGWLHTIKTSCLHFRLPIEETKRNLEGVTSALIPCEAGAGFNAGASKLFYF